MTSQDIFLHFYPSAIVVRDTFSPQSFVIKVSLQEISRGATESKAWVNAAAFLDKVLKENYLDRSSEDIVEVNGFAVMSKEVFNSLHKYTTTFRNFKYRESNVWHYVNNSKKRLIIRVV